MGRRGEGGCAPKLGAGRRSGTDALVAVRCSPRPKVRIGGACEGPLLALFSCQKRGVL